LDFSNILAILILVGTHCSINLRSTLRSVKCFLISVHSMEVFNRFYFLRYVLDGPHIVGFYFLFSFVSVIFYSMFSFFYYFALHKHPYIRWVLFFFSAFTRAFFSVFIFAVFISSECSVCLLLLLILLLLLTAIELSLGSSSPYTSTGKTNKNKYT
jgi:hypothetical protein